MFRFVFLLLAALSLVAASAACVRADVTIHVEDFEDEQGDPAFDPLFNHSISLLSENGQDQFIDGGGQFGRPGDWLLYLYFARDTVTFNTQPKSVIVSASIEIVSAGNESICFIGDNGERFFPNPGNGIIEVTAQEIGNISSVWFQSNSGFFNDLAIEIIEVPEPGVLYGMIVIGLWCGSVLIREFNVKQRVRSRIVHLQNGTFRFV